ncbi:hypothetical protein [Microcoleus sp. EPA2]|uniref:hypothetical protein n=1 Tax=Microcoleus sp. EPA2 TaxID=2841654 RepID=UPI00312B552A
MKKFQVLAGIASSVAIASSIALGDAALAFPCSYSKSNATQSGSATTLVGSGGEAQMNPYKSYKRLALGFLGLAGVLGGGAAYMSYRVGKRAQAACAAMSDNFEVFQESIADESMEAYLEVPTDAEYESPMAATESASPLLVVREHPEAPGGELDLGSSRPIASAPSAIVQ